MISPQSLKGKTIAVMGLGKSGMATLRALENTGATILAGDDNQDGQQAARKAGFNVVDLTKADWTKIDSLILSPGIPHSFPSPHPVAQLAKQHQVEIIGDVELLFRARPEVTMIGITGTNGKSTTTALIAHVLNAAGKKVQVGGNLGIPVLSFDKIMPEDKGFYVIEMSSFQCELTPSAAFDITIWLNITPDHIDRHGDMDGYIDAKKKIFGTHHHKQTIVIGVDDDYSKNVAQTILFPKATLQPISAVSVLSEGISAVGGKVFSHGEEIFNIGKTETLTGTHNAQNIAAATAACLAAGIDIHIIHKAIQTYPGLPHRQQIVRKINDVTYINDSKATNADAASKALSCYQNIFWIVGGKAKDGGLNGLEEWMPHIKRAYLIGASSDDFAKWLSGKTPYALCHTLDQAVIKASHDAQQFVKTDKDETPVVLLSPACASYDQFKNYEHRGAEFARFCNELPPALHKGSSCP
jgi:UDP-N-acetylmuramoylalanine--D-glutamate ligase